MTYSEKSYNEYKRRICLAMNYIADHLDDNPSLDDIAEAALFSKYHFHRLFHAIVGETVAGFTRRLRLERAANILIYDSSTDITSLAHDCAFSSSQNFAKAFRKHFGVSPSEYRLKNSKHGNNPSNGGNDKGITPMYDSDNVSHHLSIMNQRSCDMDVDVKEMPEYHVCYVRRIGPYGPEVCGGAFERLMRWAGPRGYAASGTALGIAWDNPDVTPPEKCRFDACITVPDGTKAEGEIGLQTIPGGTYAVYHCRIHTDEFAKAWNELCGQWLPGSGYQPDDRPSYEMCHSKPESDPENKWTIDICLPVKPM